MKPFVALRSVKIIAVVFAAGCALGATGLRAEDAKPAAKSKANAKPKINYAEHIQPIFREHCYTCHSRDTAKSDLALDSYAGVMTGGAGGEVIWPGEPDSSRLWSLVAHLENPKMPPEQDKLADAKLTLIKQWILDGALENSGSKAKARPKTNLELKVTSGSSKPVGPPPMPENLTREPYVVTRRAGAVTAMAASPWAPLIAVAGQKQVLLYHADSGEMLGILPFPEGAIHVLKFSRSGTVLLAGGGRGGQSGRVVLYDVKTGKRLAEIGDELDVVLAADINDDLTLVALGGPRRIVRIHSVADGSVQAEIRKHTDWIYSLEFSPDGVLLATSDRSAGLFVWEADTAREYQNLTGHTAGITDVSWRIDSNVLASASEDGSIRLWEMENGKQIKTWNAHPGGVAAVEYAKDGRLVSTGRDKATKLWDQNGKALQTFSAFSDLGMEVAVSHDVRRVVAGDWTGEIRLWNTADAKLVANLLENPPTLAMFIDNEASRLQRTVAEVQKLTSELTALRTAHGAKVKAAQEAARKVPAAQALIKQLEAERAAAEKAVPAKGAAIKKLRDQLSAVRSAADKARKKEGNAQREVNQKLLAAQKAIDQAEKERRDLQKSIPAKIAAIKSAQGKIKPAEEAAKKAAAEQAAAAKAVSEKEAALKAASDQVPAIKASIERAKAEKAAGDKTRTAQAAVAN